MYKILTAVFFVLFAGASALYLKESGLILQDKSQPQRQKMEIVNDEIFEKVGFTTLKLKPGEIYYDSYDSAGIMNATQAGTRLIFMSKSPVENLLKITSANIELFQDDFAKKLIDEGKNSADFISWTEANKNTIHSNPPIVNGIKFKKNKDGRIIVKFNSASNLSKDAREIYAKAKIAYLAIDPNAEEVEKEALLFNPNSVGAKEEVVQNQDAAAIAAPAKVGAKEKLDAVLAPLAKTFKAAMPSDYELNFKFDDQIIKLTQNWYTDDEVNYNINSDLNFTSFILLDDQGNEIKSELAGSVIKVLRVNAQTPKIAKAKIKYRALAQKEILLSQTYQIGQ